MLLLILFAFLAGVVTVLSPCILPVLPIVLSSSATQSKNRPLGVVIGFILSFTFFTLFLTSIVKATGISPDVLRLSSVVILFLFGLSLLIPAFQALLEKAFAAVAGKVPSNSSATGFFGGVLVGLSLGLLWTPCVGPILASVISLALTGTVTGSAVFITLAYAFGTAIPMFAIMVGGQGLLQRNQWLLRNTSHIQKGFGVIMMATAIAIFFNLDRKFQTYILTTFPQYGVGLTKIEDQPFIRQQLDNLGGTADEENMGKPSYKMLEDFGPAPELQQTGEWINSEPLTIAELKGKVVLIDFWTYSCINCIRTLPYLRSWHEKYADKGLTIIGVHTPEFEFEKKLSNVEQAVADFEIKYPVMQDNDFLTWRAFKNRYWPAKYLIDKEGRIRYTHFGEGAYDETELVIQELLSEMGTPVDDAVVSNPEYENFSSTHETYLGYSRLQYLVSNETVAKDQYQSYSGAVALQGNQFSLTGDWLISPEYSQPKADAKLRMNFTAKNVFLVMRSNNGEESKATVILDGEIVNTEAGADVEKGQVIVSKDRLYHLIELDEPGQHILELEFEDENIQAFAFTFG